MTGSSAANGCISMRPHLEISVSDANRFTHEFNLAGAYRRGHFRYGCGRHGRTFFDSSVLVVDPVLMSKVSSFLVGQFVSRLHPRTIVATPDARELAQAAARRLHEFQVYSRVVYAIENADGTYRFPFQFAGHVARSRVLVVDAVANSGKRAAGVIAACRDIDAEVTTLIAAANRGGLTAQTLEIDHFYAAETIDEPQWEEGDCELCRARMPLDEIYSPMVA